MMGVFAEFERGMIAERVRAGLARAIPAQQLCLRQMLNSIWPRIHGQFCLKFWKWAGWGNSGVKANTSLRPHAALKRF
jgi:hypothetical protein